MTTVVSGGRPRHVSARYPFETAPSVTYATGQKTIDLLRGGLTATYEGIVRTQPWVFAAVSRLSFWSARVPLKLYNGEFSDTRERVLDHEVASLLKRPNKSNRWTVFALDLYWEFYTHGHGLAVKYRRSAGAPPEELWVVPWRFVSPLLDYSGMVLAYQVMIAGETYTLTPRDVVHIQYPHGIAPLEALTRTVQSEDAAMTYQTEALKNGVTPRASFTSDGDFTGKKGDEDLARLRAALQEFYAGPEGVNFALLHSGLKYDGAIGVSPHDMGLDALRKLSREEVAAAFDISPPFLGILDRATFDNITELRSSAYEDSLGPKLEVVESSFQSQLVDSEPVWDGAGLFIEYDMGAILKPNPEGQARQALMEQQSSTTTIDDRRRQRNLKPFGIAGVTDVPLIPANMYPAGAEPPGGGGSSSNKLGDDLTAEAFRSGQPAKRKPARQPEDGSE